MNIEGLLLILVGLFAMAGGLFDWEWFMTNRRAAFFVRILGRGGTRVFYIILGIAIAVVGVLLV